MTSSQQEPLPITPPHVPMERPIVLEGATYKIKTPLYEHAVYVTINDIVDGEIRRPFELFINSKEMEHFQWVVALTRILSATFRNSDDVMPVLAELRSVFDPKGGYFKKGGKWMPSLVAEIGQVIEQHIARGGRDCEGDGAPQTIKTGAHMDVQHIDVPVTFTVANPSNDMPFPAGAFLCPKCLIKAMVVSDGCMTCLHCGDSKCS